MAATSSAIGSNAQARATGSTATGYDARVLQAATDGTALGSRAQVKAVNAVALGAGSVADRANSVSVGTAGCERQVTNVAAGTQDTDAVNIGQFNSALDGVDADLAGTVKYDDDDKSSLTLAGADGTTVGNVAAGALSANSTEAVNGGQLFGMGDEVAQSLGGGAQMGSNGFTGPTYMIQGGNYYNVGDALGALDGAIRASTADSAQSRPARRQRQRSFGAGDGQQPIAEGWRQRCQPRWQRFVHDGQAGGATGQCAGHRRSGPRGPGRPRSGNTGIGQRLHRHHRDQDPGLGQRLHRQPVHALDDQFQQPTAMSATA